MLILKTILNYSKINFVEIHLLIDIVNAKCTIFNGKGNNG